MRLFQELFTMTDKKIYRKLRKQEATSYCTTVIISIIIVFIISHYYIIIITIYLSYVNKKLFHTIHPFLWALYLYLYLLKEWSLLPNALRPFKIYCAPPNLGITRT